MSEEILRLVRFAVVIDTQTIDSQRSGFSSRLIKKGFELKNSVRAGLLMCRSCLSKSHIKTDIHSLVGFIFSRPDFATSA